jgi:hypothetical protein
MRLSESDASYRPLPGPGYLRWKRQQQCLVRFIVVAILAWLASPADSDARAGYEIHPGGINLILPVGQRGNYVISVTGNERQRVQFKVKGPSAATEYSTRGSISSRGIQASFGPLGRIDVGLHLVRYPSGPSHTGRCTGRAPVIQVGTYHGTIKFLHYGNVPGVSAKRGRVYFKRNFRQVCRRERLQSGLAGTKPKLRVEVGLLKVSGKSEGRTILLQAFSLALKRNPAHSGGNLTTTTFERRGETRITKTINVSVDHDSFAMGERDTIPETVEVELPKPFAGQALYSNSPESSPNWTGDLSVNLSGMGRIPLTGPSLDAIFCRGSSVARLNRCIGDSGP